MWIITLSLRPDGDSTVYNSGTWNIKDGALWFYPMLGTTVGGQVVTTLPFTATFKQ